MKKLFTLIAVAIVVVASSFKAQAQENVVKFNLFSLAVATYNFSYERAFSENKSAQLGIFYTGFKVGETKFAGVGVTPEIRFFLGEKEAPRGFYVAPFFRYQNFTLKTEEAGFEEKATLSTIGGGLVIGNQWLFNDRISMDIFIGPSYNSGKVKVDDGSSEDTFETGVFTGFGVRTGLTLGIAF